MRAFVMVLALALMPVALSATDVSTRAPLQPHVQQTATQTVLPHAEQIQVQDRVERQREAAESAAALQPTQTNWWWLVGAIVVGGVILAVLL